MTQVRSTKFARVWARRGLKLGCQVAAFVRRGDSVLVAGPLIWFVCMPRNLSIAIRVLASALLVVGCGQGAPPPGTPQAPTVSVAKPVQRSIVDQDEYVGRFVAV